MNQLWLLYSGITILYIVILVVYFLRRTKTHEKELTQFFSEAKKELETHKQSATLQANTKVVKVIEVVKKIQEAIEVFEEQAQEEYNQILSDAKDERRELIASAKAEIEELFKGAEQELKDYRAKRQSEIEKNLVKMVITVTEKVVETSLSAKQHKDLIAKALEEVKANKERS